MDAGRDSVEKEIPATLGHRRRVLIFVLNGVARDVR